MTSEYVVDETRPAVTYGPTHPSDDRGEWVLSVSCESERVEILLDDESMYQLWVEVRNVPWPERDDSERDRLVRQVVHAANDADKQMLQEALQALGVRP
jgi:hypothetical protein